MKHKVWSFMMLI